MLHVGFMIFAGAIIPIFQSQGYCKVSQRPVDSSIVRIRDTMPMLRRSQGFVAGEWRDSASGASFKVTNPFNNEEVATVADFGVADVEAAIDNAHNTWQEWRKSTLKQR